MKRWLGGLLSVAIICTACACGEKVEQVYDGTTIANITYPKAAAFEDDKTKTEIREQNPVNDKFLAALNSFSYETASAVLSSTDGNVNYSPLSLYFTLAVAGTGAYGDTKSQIFELLGVLNSKELSKQCGNLYRQLYTDNEISKLKIADSIWLDVNATVNDDFIKNAAENLYASSHTVDFADASAGKEMGQWVADNTNGKLTPAFKTDQEQLMSIINTVYFYDEWNTGFDKEKTASDVFHAPDGDINAQFMNKTCPSMSFVKEDGFTRSMLGLKGSGEMIFILPDPGVSVDELLSSPDSVKKLFEGGRYRCGEVIWKIPKFDFGSGIELSGMLKSLGMTDAFKETADFSRITDEKIFISNVKQHTHIAIDENGVEASAFTKIDYAGSALPDGRAEMILDRPFIYGITSSNGTLIFVGKCYDPSV